MSFANIDLEAQKDSNGRVTDAKQTSTQNELDRIIESTSNQLQSFGNLITQFESQKRNIGTKRDNIRLRNTIDSLISNLNELERGIKKLLANLSGVINEKSDKFEITNRQIIIQERLLNQYNDLHRQYLRSSKDYNDKKQTSPLDLDETTPLLDSKPSGQQQQQQQQQQRQQVQVQEDLINETELEYHRLLTEERDREIQQAHEGIQEVNSIFKDLGTLVHQQGEQLDLVEDNIAQLHSNTQQASGELTKAHEYQKKKGKWSCILLIALCIFVLVVVLIVIS